MEKEISDREEKISQRRQALENLEHDLDERDAICEIVVRLNVKEQNSFATKKFGKCSTRTGGI